jgi:hypothetical protein
VEWTNLHPGCTEEFIPDGPLAPRDTLPPSDTRREWRNRLSIVVVTVTVLMGIMTT